LSGQLSVVLGRPHAPLATDEGPPSNRTGWPSVTTGRVIRTRAGSPLVEVVMFASLLKSASVLSPRRARWMRPMSVLVFTLLLTRCFFGAAACFCSSASRILLLRLILHNSSKQRTKYGISPTLVTLFRRVGASHACAGLRPLTCASASTYSLVMVLFGYRL